jgi:hypothetical protein
VRRGDIGSAVGTRMAVGTDTRGPDCAFKAQRGACAWQPCGVGALAGGPSAERGKLTGGSHASAISEIKTLPNESSSKQIARN